MLIKTTNNNHELLQNIGDNTHADIDLHIAAETNPHNITISQLSDVDLKGVDDDKILKWATDKFVIGEASGTPDLSGLVPYNDADRNVNLGENTLIAGTLIGVKGGYEMHGSSTGFLYGEIDATGPGSIEGGASDKDGKGVFAGGYSCYGGKIIASGAGSISSGYVDTFDIKASGNGAFAQGMNSFGYITSTGNGAFAQGWSDFEGIISSGSGSFAQGYTQNEKIESSGFGSFAQGYTQNEKIESSGSGSFAQGYTSHIGPGLDLPIIASANNAVQFGPGTNDIADNLQVGTGLSLYGKPSIPTTPRDGMLWQDGTALYIRLNDTTYTVDLTKVM